MAELVYDKDGRLLFTKEMKEEYTLLMPQMLPVHFGMFQKLLQLEDYAPEQKRSGASVGAIYWPIVVAIYLGVSFLTRAWNRTWIIWPCAGVLFAAICALVSAMKKRGE